MKACWSESPSPCGFTSVEFSHMLSSLTNCLSDSERFESCNLVSDGVISELEVGIC